MSARSMIATIVLAACELGTATQVPTAAAGPAPLGPELATVPNPSFQPFAFAVDNCVETVDVSGTFHEVVQFFVGPRGKEHFRFHLNAKGTGIGQSTGARYQWNDRLFDITNVAPVGAVPFVLNDYARLIGQGGAVNSRLAIQVKVTINANGDATVDRLRVRDACG